VKFGNCRNPVRRHAVVHVFCGLVDQCAGRFDRGGHLGDVGLDHLELANGLAAVNIDREQFKRVLINLFENAVEALGGKGTITVRANLTKSGVTQIEVADEGPGIAAEDVPKLFEPEFSRKKKKSGLGLAIVLRIIKDHNGTIRVEQNRPRGARFIIELPVAPKKTEVRSTEYGVRSDMS